MAAPSFVSAATGATDAGGAWSYTCQTPGAAGRLIIVQLLQDGSTNAIAVTGASNIENLAGTDNAWTQVPGLDTGGSFSLGSTLALQFLYIGRSLSTSAPTISGTNSTSEDLYIRSYEFMNVAAGTTLEQVIENGTAGSWSSTNGNSDTAADATVTTLGVDRLAVNFLAINDDNPFAGFTGQSGGTWTTQASYAAASGTDGAIYVIDAAMAAAGTIDGGTGSITDSDAWGVVGFALIGTTVAATDSIPHYRQPRVIGQAVARASSWMRRHDGLFLPERRLWVPRPS
jgi:hypothetical protein